MREQRLILPVTPRESAKKQLQKGKTNAITKLEKRTSEISSIGSTTPCGKPGADPTNCVEIFKERITGQTEPEENKLSNAP